MTSKNAGLGVNCVYGNAAIKTWHYFIGHISYHWSPPTAGGGTQIRTRDGPRFLLARLPLALLHFSAPNRRDTTAAASGAVDFTSAVRCRRFGAVGGAISVPTPDGRRRRKPAR